VKRKDLAIIYAERLEYAKARLHHYMMTGQHKEARAMEACAMAIMDRLTLINARIKEGN
jgi:hypothetical protein